MGSLATDKIDKNKETAMKTKHRILSKISLSSGLVVALAFAVWLLGPARAAEHKHEAHDMMNR